MLVALRSFLRAFGSEAQCRALLEEARWGRGFCCPRCASTATPSRVRTRGLLQCASCRYQVSITAGTILENTKLPLRTWFLAMFLVLTTKKGVSSLELARRVGVSESTAWFMVQRIAAVAEVALPATVDGRVERASAMLPNPREARRYEGDRAEDRVVALLRVDVAALSPLRLLRVASCDPLDLHAATADHVTEKRVRDAVGGPSGRVPPARLALINLAHVMGGVHTRFASHRLQAYLDLFAFRFTWRGDLGTGFVGAARSVHVARRRTRRDIVRERIGLGAV